MNEHDGRQAETLKLVLDAAAEISWTPEIADSRFSVLREVGYSFALFGSFAKAFETFRMAADCSESTMDKLLSAVDCVVLLRELGLHDQAMNELIKVEKAVVLLDLSQCGERDADALLMLGEHLAKLNIKFAYSLYEAYLALKSRKLRLTTAFTDERFYGQQLRLESALATAVDDFQLANELNRQAFDLYKRLGIRSQASRIAFELGGEEHGQQYRDYARQEAERLPKSSLAVQVRGGDPEFAAITLRARNRRKRRASLRT